MIVGIVGFQGDVSEHRDMLLRLAREKKADIRPLMVKSRKDLDEVDALIIPGGESTTIYKLLRQYSIYEEIGRRISEGMPVMGTCAGIILLSSRTNDDRVEGLGALDVEINRNAYGRQIDSFMDDVDVEGIGKFRAVFIRAPVIEVYGKVEVLSEYRGKAIMVRQGNILGMTFHPELTSDFRIHSLFIDMIGGGGSSSSGTR